ncbi:galanin receptor 2a-like [Dreissena polymorpha]|uniref:G-protein coupled receptors family 1 profile domain-containing protein n=1 Tax=Dreissena polymorpha TaxID=45954 RepID=A0A9D4GEC2_DREPO|nr:galanin receptor 2a-like [Dreissena polymorpha]KAH3813405.1 hypothetical protein DPMN_141861 [Dreissena polymorpha]
MNSTTAPASNVTLINVSEQETFNTTSSKLREWDLLPKGYYGDTSVLLWRVIPPILITIGTIGNTMTMFVLLRQKKMTSTALFLFALALSDTLTLFSAVLNGWMRFTWDLNIQMLSRTACKAHVYLTYCSVHLSSWFIVAVTLERTACVLIPHKVRLGCSPRNAGLIIFAIVLAVLGINIILPVIIDLKFVDYIGDHGWGCYPSNKVYFELFYSVYQWIDITLYFGAPFPLLLTGNVIIVVQLARSRSRNRRMRISGQGRDTRRLSILMIALCGLFFLTMTPMAVMAVYSENRFEKIFALKPVDPYTAWNDYQYLLFLRTVVELVGYFNNTFNFVVYVFSGSKLQTELKNALCC